MTNKRTQTIDCPYCKNTDDVEVGPSMDSPWYVGPFMHECSDCARSYIYLVEIDLTTKVYVNYIALCFNRKEAGKNDKPSK